ncbi:MAG: hypothetical protein K5Q00_02130, partial [Gammaproteobacteria bacterium]|nr:hypothetical protein [Gammaproteobacteria bacterium]
MYTVRDIRQIRKESARLARQQRELLEQEKSIRESKSKLESLYRKSGFKTARDLIEALAEHFNVRIYKENEAPKRKRTRVTTVLRDAMLADVKAGASMNAVAKKYDVSYAVVVKATKGGYDRVRFE